MRATTEGRHASRNRAFALWHMIARGVALEFRCLAEECRQGISNFAIGASSPVIAFSAGMALGPVLQGFLLLPISGAAPTHIGGALQFSIWTGIAAIIAIALAGVAFISQTAIARERARMYGDLADRDATLRRVLETNVVGILMWDLDGFVVEANDTLLRMVGHDREDLAARRLHRTELMPPESLGSHGPHETEYYHKDGSRVPVRVGSTRPAEALSQGVAVVLDLTERKRTEEALRQSQADLIHLTRVMTIGVLTASIAHEINQPLAALATNASTCLRWLAHQPTDLDEARASLHRMVHDSNRIGEVVTAIRSLVKKSPTVQAKLDVNDAIQEVLSLAEPEARRHGILTRTDLAAGLPSACGDRVQLQQVILNLVMNGIEAMQAVAGRPRELWIRSRRFDARMALVSVRDSGIGMTAETLGRVFEAFYTTKTEGMGMGLSISRSIIAAHGGQLWPSANDDYGVTFQFTIPVDEIGAGCPAGSRTDAGLAA